MSKIISSNGSDALPKMADRMEGVFPVHQTAELAGNLFPQSMLHPL